MGVVWYDTGVEGKGRGCEGAGWWWFAGFEARTPWVRTSCCSAAGVGSSPHKPVRTTVVHSLCDAFPSASVKRVTGGRWGAGYEEGTAFLSGIDSYISHGSIDLGLDRLVVGLQVHQRDWRITRPGFGHEESSKLANPFHFPWFPRGFPRFTTPTSGLTRAAASTPLLLLNPALRFNPAPPLQPLAAASTSLSSRAKVTEQLLPTVLRFVDAERGPDAAAFSTTNSARNAVSSAHPAHRP